MAENKDEHTGADIQDSDDKGAQEVQVTPEEAPATSEEKVGEEGMIEETEGEEGGPPQLATTKQKIWLASLLAAFTMILLIFGALALNGVERTLHYEMKVKWSAPQGATLKPGPSSFWYDSHKGLLVHRGPVSDERKKELFNLIQIDEKAQEGDTTGAPKVEEAKKGEGEQPKAASPQGSPALADTGKAKGETAKEIRRSYEAAVDQMAYESNAELDKYLLLLLLLGGVGGSLGVQIRSISNFIGVACFKNVLDVRRWWPWYAMRPLTGFLLGLLFVVLVKAGLLTAGNYTPTGNLWWLGVTIIVGFGASDFTERLRLLAQTLFGKS